MKYPHARHWSTTGLSCIANQARGILLSTLVSYLTIKGSNLYTETSGLRLLAFFTRTNQAYVNRADMPELKPQSRGFTCYCIIHNCRTTGLPYLNQLKKVVLQTRNQSVQDLENSHLRRLNERKRTYKSHWITISRMNSIINSQFDKGTRRKPV
jgi:hypothetical protein